MTELFSNISQELRDIAEFSWHLALSKNTLIETVEFLNNVTNYYKVFGTPEEVEFLQFYFRMKMEMMKE